MLGVTGKDAARIAELILRGSLVSGASRFRWTGWQTDPESIRELLATFPDPDPTRPFAASGCVKAILRGGRSPIEIPRDAVSRKTLFQRQTFWDLLMQVVTAGKVDYSGYSYRERADRYLRAIAPAEMEQIRTIAFLTADLHVARGTDQSRGR
jgi:hypothetical protein